MKSVGITFLIAEKRTEITYRAHLISCIFEFISLDSLKKDIADKIAEISEEPIYTYIGIEDMFSVSGGLSNGGLLGKSSLDEFNTVEKAYKLINSLEKFELKKLIENKDKEYIFSLIYFYLDRSVSCLFYFEGVSFYDALGEIRKNANKPLYKSKIAAISSVKEKMDIKRLKYVGIERVFNRSNYAKRFGGFEAHYKDFGSIKEIKSIVLDQTNEMDSIDDFVNEL